MKNHKKVVPWVAAAVVFAMLPSNGEAFRGSSRSASARNWLGSQVVVRVQVWRDYRFPNSKRADDFLDAVAGARLQDAGIKPGGGFTAEEADNLAEKAGGAAGGGDVGNPGDDSGMGCVHICMECEQESGPSMKCHYVCCD
ncbi:MAG TPA: hypothetical protein VFX30_04475 [bacterium]|nr:hypothetical protein [bacterium]